MSIEERIESYLGNGGLFNPELMDHVKVGLLILDIRDELSALRLKIPPELDSEIYEEAIESIEASLPLMRSMAMDRRKATAELEALRAQIAASDLLLTAGAAELKQASSAISERDDLRDDNAALQQRCELLEGALKLWDCPVCHGSGDYADGDRQRMVTCHECLGTGRHHFARAALEAQPESLKRVHDALFSEGADKIKELRSERDAALAQTDALRLQCETLTDLVEQALNYLLSSKDREEGEDYLVKEIRAALSTKIPVVEAASLRARVTELEKALAYALPLALELRTAKLSLPGPRLLGAVRR